MDDLRGAMARARTYEDIKSAWLADKAFVLNDSYGSFTVRSQAADELPRAEGFELRRVAIEERRGESTRRYEADSATIEAARGDSLANSGLRIVLHGVRASDGEGWVHRGKETLGPILLAPGLIAELEGMSSAELYRASRAIRADDPLEPVRIRAEAIHGETLRSIAATLHERAAFSVCVVFLVVLGVALGIVFRGSHVMTAFGISFVPSLIVIISIVMGKQMTNNEGTYQVGLLVLWSGIAIVTALNVWVVLRVLRR